MRRLLSLILLTAVVVCASAQTKRALVIGLGQQEDPSWRVIHGDKDVPYVTEMLKGCGYRQITTLVNKQATKANIVREMHRLAKVSKPGDIIYIHFSGHGQQMTDINGDETDDWDECWIPYDAYLRNCAKDRGGKHLTDDENYDLLLSIRKSIGKSGKMLVVVDACHSGNSTKGIESGGEDPAEDSVATRGAGVYERFIVSTPRRKVKDNRNEQWITLSACKSYQENKEMPGRPVGRLTYALYSMWKNHTLTFANVKSFMAKYPAGRTGQDPELHPKTTSESELSKIFK